MCLIPVLRGAEANASEFEARMVYTASYRPSRASVTLFQKRHIGEIWGEGERKF